MLFTSNVAFALGIAVVFAICLKKTFLPTSRPWTNIAFLWSSVMPLIFFLALWQRPCFIVLYLSSSLIIYSNSSSHTQPSVKVLEMMSCIPSSLIWANNLISSCFFCLIFRDGIVFRATVVAIESIRLAPVKAIPIGIATPLTKADIKADLLITVVIIRPVWAVNIILLILLNFLIVFNDAPSRLERISQFPQPLEVYSFALFLNHLVHLEA